MGIRISVLIIFFLSSLNFSLLGSELLNEDYPRSWRAAKKKSKNTGKLLLVDFYFVGCSPCKKLDEQIFKVDSIRSKLEEKYVIYKYDINKESRYIVDKFKVRSFPGIIVTNHKEEKLVHISGFTSAEKFLERLLVARLNKPISYYQKNYKKNKENLLFLTEYVDLLLDGYVKGEEVFGRYYHLEKNNNCRKLNAFVSSKLMNDISELRTFLAEYSNFKFLQCEDVNHIDIVYNAGMSLVYKEDKVIDIDRVVDQTSKILNLSDEITDSLSVTKRAILYGYSKSRIEHPMIYREVLLNAYRYKRENYISIDSIYTELLGLSIDLNRSEDLRILENVLNTRSKFINNPNFIELISILQYRLGREKEAIESIIHANNLSVSQKKRFKPILPILREKGLLEPVEE